MARMSHKAKVKEARKHMTDDERATYKDERTGRKTRISMFDTEYWNARIEAHKKKQREQGKKKK